MPGNLIGPIPPELPNVDPLESGIEFFEEQKKFTFLFKYQCNKVFLNHVDSFNGRHMLKYIGSREYVKPFLLEELPGEGGSMPSVVEPKSDAPSKTGESGGLSNETHTGDGSKQLVNADWDMPKTDVDEAMLLNRGEFERDSLESLLGGLLTAEQIAKLRSMPNKMQRAEYLKSILNSIESVFDLPPEECNMEPTCYELAGTLKYCDECLPEIFIYLKEQVRDIKCYLPTLLSCSTVIFDISRDPSQIEEARWALRAILCSFEYLEKKSMSCFRKIQDVRKFILISSVMTWECTDKMRIRKKPVGEDYLENRKPHPLFKEHKHLEQEVVRAGLRYQDKFKTYVLASGITYGYEEDRLNYLFDLGWKNEEELPLLGDGHNSLPVIHVEDLAMLTFHCMTRVDTTPTYLFAVEKNPPTLLQITENLSKGLTTGKTAVYPINQPLPLNINIHEDTYAMLTSELLLEPYVHKLNLPWKYHENLIKNVPTIIDEYIESRNLCPFKVIVGGLPSSGKTHLAERIAQIYDVLYITAEETVKNYVEKLEREALEKINAREMLRGEEGFDEAESIEDGGGVEEGEGEDFIREEEDHSPARLLFANELEEIKYSMRINGGMPDDSIVVRIMKKRLEEKDVVNHGYVLDGWPYTEPQARAMFGKPEEPEELSKAEMSEEEEEEEAEEEEDYGESGKTDEIKTRNINIYPNFFIQLEGDCDDLLYKILLAKEDLERVEPSSVELASRMEQYRNYERTCCRAFDFFDNSCLEVKVLRYQISSDPCPFLGKTLKHILDSLGPPTNTGFLKRYLNEFKLIRTAKDDELMMKRKEGADGIEKMDIEYFRAACQFMDRWGNFQDSVVKEVSDGYNDDLLPEKVVDMAVRALMEFKQACPDDHLGFLVEFFLNEYEKEKGKVVIPEQTCDGSLAFRRCIASVLQNCEPNCLALLPQAVDIILKYRRYANAKGFKFPPDSCRDQAVQKSSDLLACESESLSVSQLSLIEASTCSMTKDIPEMNLSKLVDLLIKTDPIWKDRLSSEKVGKKLAISDESLKLLLQQLRELSCEIQYRLKKRGIAIFDNDSLIGSCGVWPPDTIEKECSAEIRAEQFSQPSIDTKKQLEYLALNKEITTSIISRYGSIDSESSPTPTKLLDRSSKEFSENLFASEDPVIDKSKSVIDKNDKKPSIQPSDISL